MKILFLLTCCLNVLLLNAQSSIKDVALNNNKFAFDIYKKQTEKKVGKNFFYSPFSISSAFGMCYAGANNLTADEMAKVLYFDKNNAAFHQKLTGIQNSVCVEKEQRKIQLANSIWIQEKLPLLPNYTDLMLNTYRSENKRVDFYREADECRLKINKWVANKTNKLIKDLLPEGSLDKNTRMVLVNALYFKMKWAFEFDEKQIAEHKFYEDKETFKEIPFMLNNQNYRMNEQKDFVALEIPYIEGKQSMLILLPKKKDGLSDMEQKMSEKKLVEVISELKYQNVMLFLPEWKQESAFSVSKNLKDLGMKTAFEDVADFSKMMDFSKKNAVKLKISDVLHKAVIDVTASGTEAAAATAIIMSECDAVVEKKTVKVFKADHPFMYFIRDHETGSILFMGRVIKF
jgi:serpin B